MTLERLIKALIILAGIGLFIYLVTLNVPKSTGKGIVAVSALSFVALFMFVNFLFDRKRRAAIAASLSTRGMIIGLPRDAEVIHRLADGQRNLEAKLWAHGQDSAGDLRIAEFTFITGRGKHSRTHRNMQASRACPDRWPYFRLSRRASFLKRPISNLAGSEDYGLENEAFSKRWSLECDDRDFVLLFLSPIVQDWLMLAPKHESWTIDQGRLCITHELKCDVAKTEALINRLNEFLQLVPPELAAYERPH